MCLFPHNFNLADMLSVAEQLGKQFILMVTPIGVGMKLDFAKSVVLGIPTRRDSCIHLWL